MTLNGQNVLVRKKKSFYGAHQKNLNEDKPMLSEKTRSSATAEKQCGNFRKDMQDIIYT